MSTHNGISSNATSLTSWVDAASLHMQHAASEHAAASLATFSNGGRALREGMFHFVVEQLKSNIAMLEELHDCRGPSAFVQLQQRWLLTNGHSVSTELMRMSQIMTGMVPGATAKNGAGLAS
jgi:hypothetical protein